MPKPPATGNLRTAGIEKVFSNLAISKTPALNFDRHNLGIATTESSPLPYGKTENIKSQRMLSALKEEVNPRQAGRIIIDRAQAMQKSRPLCKRSLTGRSSSIRRIFNVAFA